MKHQPVLLVVEDDAAVRRFTTLVLESNGYQVIAAAAAAECLAILESRAVAIDLVITDVVMPRMGGLDLAAELDRRYPDLKILYISGYSASIAVQGVASKAPYLVLPKPFTEEELIARVRQLCS
jgi:CheY-like chemotaxis protein